MTPSPDDILLWPDGEWCFRGYLHQYGHKSDDYEVIQAESFRWNALLEELGE